MGFNNLSDSELKNILTTEGGLKKFLDDKDNLAKFLGADHMTRRRVADIFKYDKGLSKADIKKIVDKVAWVHSTVTDFV